MTHDIIEFAQDAPVTGARRLADLPNRVVAGDPHHITRMRHQGPDGTLMAGTWTSTPGRWHAFSDRDEFCFIVSGHVELISEDGRVQSFSAGESFLIPNGFCGDWHVIEETTKHFVIRDYTAGA